MRCSTWNGWNFWVSSCCVSYVEFLLFWKLSNYDITSGSFCACIFFGKSVLMFWHFQTPAQCPVFLWAIPPSPQRMVWWLSASGKGWVGSKRGRSENLWAENIRSEGEGNTWQKGTPLVTPYKQTYTQPGSEWCKPAPPRTYTCPILPLSFCFWAWCYTICGISLASLS